VNGKKKIHKAIIFIIKHLVLEFMRALIQLWLS